MSKELTWYVVEWFDGRNSMTQKQPVKAVSKADARHRMLGSKEDIKRNFIKKIKVRLFR